MRYAIVYDRRVFKVGEDKYIVMYLAGANDAYKVVDGEEIPAKEWYQISHNGESVLTLEELSQVLDYIGDYDDIAKSRHTFFDRETNEFKKWILSGISRAVTVEEAFSQGIFNKFIICNIETGEELANVETTEDLLDSIGKLKASGVKMRLKLSYRGSTPKKRALNKKPNEKKLYDKFYSIEVCYEEEICYGDPYMDSLKRYLMSLGRATYRTYHKPGVSGVKKFKTEKEAQRYVDKYNDTFLTKFNSTLKVVEIKEPVML